MSDVTDTSTVITATEVVTELTRCWFLPPDIEEQVLTKCHDGTSLVCKVCASWDDEKTKFARIPSRLPFTYGNFNQHTKSSRHKKNVMKMARCESENKRRIEKGLPAKKRQKLQSILTFATKEPTPTQVYNRIVHGDVPVQLASPANWNTVAEEEARFYDNVNMIEKGDNKNCCGILAKKDLSNPVIQKGLFYLKKYCFQDDTMEFCVRKVYESEQTLSFFATACSGSDTSVS